MALDPLPPGRGQGADLGSSQSPDAAEVVEEVLEEIYQEAIERVGA
jgi:hypothetical protein